ncbi:MAG: 50S ribosomal protein L25 [Dissulfurispiraceae bacterium]|jgi:large subunit ribosomal protein L25|nr:50S ribosomal protein L25 [Dissulfurispiraceae bacterium]
MQITKLKAEKRDNTGKGVARGLRREGMIPSVLYRAGESTAIQLPGKELALFISRSAGEQVIVNLEFNDGAKQAIVKDYQVDPVAGKLLHVDFQEILATETIKVNVHIILKGEPIGVKRDGGILQHVLREIEIECLPNMMPGHIDIDVSALEINQTIHVSNLKLQDGIKVLTDPEEVIVTVTAVKEEAAAPVESEEETAAEPEVIKKGKKPEEAPSK